MADAYERSKDDADRSIRIGRWLGAQTNNLDADRRDAARHVLGRWDVNNPWFSLGRTIRTLRREESPHLTGLLALADDFAQSFPDDCIADIGSAGPFTPIDVRRCTDCRREAVPGADKCGRHGGQFLSVRDAERISQHTAARVMEATDQAVRVLTDLMDHGKSEMVRMQTAFGLLDRAGVSAAQKIEIDISSAGQDAATLIAKRLEQIEGSMLKAEAIEAARDEESGILDLEVLREEDPEAEPEAT